MAIETIVLFGALAGTVTSLVPQISSKLKSYWSKGGPAGEEGKSFVVTVKEASGKTVGTQTIENMPLDKIVTEIRTMALQKPKEEKETAASI
jgi:hypothetical protein